MAIETQKVNINKIELDFQEFLGLIQYGPLIRFLYNIAFSKHVSQEQFENTVLTFLPEKVMYNPADYLKCNPFESYINVISHEIKCTYDKAAYTYNKFKKTDLKDFIIQLRHRKYQEDYIFNYGNGKKIFEIREDGYISITGTDYEEPIYLDMYSERIVKEIFRRYSNELDEQVKQTKENLNNILSSGEYSTCYTQE